MNERYARACSLCAADIKSYVSSYLSSVRGLYFLRSAADLALFLKGAFLAMDAGGRTDLTKLLRRSYGVSELDPSAPPPAGADDGRIERPSLPPLERTVTAAVEGAPDGSFLSPLARLRVSANPPWPMTMFLTAATLADYNRVLNLLLSLKYCLGRVDKLRLRPKARPRPGGQRTPPPGPSEESVCL